MNDELNTSKVNTSQLIANSKSFYFDYHDGQYGYNTSSSRGADTFSPFKSTPTSGIYGAYSICNAGYYAYSFWLYGWPTSTKLIINISNTAIITIHNITSCKFDGVTQTVNNNQWSPASGIACDNTDHIITFTVKSGSVPDFYANTSQTNRKINTAVFNN